MGKVKRERTSYTVKQKETLEKLYQKTNYPDIFQVEEVSLQTGVPEAKVTIWFKNRRAKERGKVSGFKARNSGYPNSVSSESSSRHNASPSSSSFSSSPSRSVSLSPTSSVGASSLSSNSSNISFTLEELSNSSTTQFSSNAGDAFVLKTEKLSPAKSFEFPLNATDQSSSFVASSSSSSSNLSFSLEELSTSKANETQWPWPSNVRDAIPQNQTNKTNFVKQENVSTPGTLDFSSHFRKGNMKNGLIYNTFYPYPYMPGMRVNQHFYPPFVNQANHFIPQLGNFYGYQAFIQNPYSLNPSGQLMSDVDDLFNYGGNLFPDLMLQQNQAQQPLPELSCSDLDLFL